MPDSSPDPTASWTRRHTWLGLGLLAALGVFFVATLRPGHTAGDFFRMMEHARNMVEGRAYDATLWIQFPDGQPITFFPPLLPLALALVYALVGLNLTVLKLLIVASFLAALVLFAAFVRKDLPPPYVYLATAFVGLQPWYWDLKDDVMADLPFLLLVFLTLILMRRYYERGGPGARTWGTGGVGLGLSMVAAEALRSVGLVFLPTLLVYDLLKGRRWWPSRRFWPPAVIFTAGAVLHRVLIASDADGTYGEYFAAELSHPLEILQHMILRAYAYVHGSTVNMLFENGYLPVLRYLVGGLILGLAAFGLVAQLRRRVSVAPVFAGFYFGILVVYPFQVPRYMIPLHAILFFYTVYGLYLLARRVQQPVRRRALVAGVAALVFATYLMNYTTRDFEHVKFNVLPPSAPAMYAYVAEHVPEDALVVYREPNALAFLARRRSTLPTEPEGRRPRYAPERAEELFDLFASLEASYLLTGPRTDSYREADVLPLWNLPRDYPGRFELVHRTDGFELYRIIEDGSTRPAEEAETPGTPG